MAKHHLEDSTRAQVQLWVMHNKNTNSPQLYGSFSHTRPVSYSREDEGVATSPLSIRATAPTASSMDGRAMRSLGRTTVRHPQLTQSGISQPRLMKGEESVQFSPHCIMMKGLPPDTASSIVYYLLLLVEEGVLLSSRHCPPVL
jgi:hypothetical protein